MSTTITPPVETPKPFDAKAHIEQRNANDALRQAGKPIVAPIKPEEPKPAEPAEAKQPTRVARSLNRLQREVGAAEERARILKEENERLRAVPAAAPTAAVDSDPEPIRKNFATDLEFARAVNKWDARQEAKKIVDTRDEEQSKADQQAALAAAVKASGEKFEVDRAIFGEEEWKKRVDQMAELEEEDPAMSWSSDTVFAQLLFTSDVRAAVLFWASENPEKFKALIAEKDIPTLVRRFSRVEGIAEKLLDEYQKKSDDAKKKAAPASEKNGTSPSPKAGEHPAEEAQTSGRNGATAPRPRPTSEVAARGGSAPPDEPKVGSAAWMEARNRAKAPNLGPR